MLFAFVHWLFEIYLPLRAFHMLYSAVIIFSITFIFKATLKQRLFYPVIIISVEYASVITAGLLFGVFYNMTIFEYMDHVHTPFYFYGEILAKVLFFIYIRILHRLHVMNDKMLPLRHWLLIMLVPVMSVAICFGLAVASTNYTISRPIAPFLIMTGILGTNMLFFFMYDELVAQSKKFIENERAKNSMASDIRQYNSIIAQSKEYAQLFHDVRKHRETVRDLVAAGDIESAINYIDKLLSTRISLYDTSITRHNPAVDMLLRRKITEAINNKITVNCDYEAESAIPIDDVSLCLIFGNALENAIEACQKISDDGNKRIEVHVLYKDGRLVIRISNTSEPVNIIDNSCVTTKRNKLLHGYGLNNIKKIVEEKGGNSVIQYENGMFIMSIMFLL